jgi:hypothetical protein
VAPDVNPVIVLVTLEIVDVESIFVVGLADVPPKIMYLRKFASVIAVQLRVTRLLHEEAVRPAGAAGGFINVVTVIVPEFKLDPYALNARTL